MSDLGKKLEGSLFNRQDSPTRPLLHGVSEIFHLLSPLASSEIGEPDIKSQDSSIKMKRLKKQFKEQLRDRTKSEQRALIKRFMKRKNPKSTLISKDPINHVLLTEQGYKERAERRKKKRDKNLN